MAVGRINGTQDFVKGFVAAIEFTETFVGWASLEVKEMVLSEKRGESYVVVSFDDNKEVN